MLGGGTALCDAKSVRYYFLVDKGGVIKHYFVDEAGDLTFFDRKGRIIVGNGKVPRCVMVGLVDLPDPIVAHERLEKLRRALMAEPFFSGVPSMRPEAKKTALAFHAKDDLPEVRYEVMKLLPSLNPKAIIGIRRKYPLAMRYKAMFESTGRKPKPNTIYNMVYDDLVAQIFRNKLHSTKKVDVEEIKIVFARRGKSGRQEALRSALDKAKANFEARWGKRPFPPITIDSTYPSESAGLQVVDYYLWAMQRMYEKGQERFYRALEPQYRLTMDLDDKRNRAYGEWYSDSNKLDPRKIWPAAS